MDTYVGSKIIKAEKMTRGDYNTYRGWTIPANENPNDEGYHVKYSDNYESWSPKKQFEEAYRLYDTEKLPATAILMISDDYKDRFLAEYKQLKIRYDGLINMIKNWENGTLPFTLTCPRSTYDLQLKAMADYLAVLEARAVMENVDLNQ